jgi:predicted alpha/beta hydrolase family esterase
MKRVIIVRGWEFSPTMHWYPWLKKQLVKEGFNVMVPLMPNTDAPVIAHWVRTLARAVGTPDKDTYLIGHSIGCQTILRYLQTIKTPIGGCVFVAPWLTLTPEALPDADYRKIAKPWLERPIKFAQARKNAKKIIAFFADDDPYVSLENKNWLEERLLATTRVVSKQGHFTGDDGVKEVPDVLNAILEIST